MSASEKAHELFGYCHYRVYFDNNMVGENYKESTEDCAKHLAKFMVDQIVLELESKWGAPYIGYEDSASTDWAIKRLKFWEDVKSEIENIYLD
jgi:hypothetical protein